MKDFTTEQEEALRKKYEPICERIRNDLNEYFERKTREHFLGEGKFTKRDDLVRRVSEKLRQFAEKAKRTLPEEITEYMRHKLTHDDSNKNEEFRKRTGSEVLKSGYCNGCTDRALVFAVLARELGIPTQYVETLSEEWLRSNETEKVVGHAFVNVFIDGEWKAYDPRLGFAPDYVLGGERFVEIGKGLDFSEIFIKKDEGYKPTPTNLQDLLEVAFKIKGGIK